MHLPIVSQRIAQEHDVVAARQRARGLALLLGFDGQNQVRIATAVSEIARNAFRYAGGGGIQFVLEESAAIQYLLVRISDHGRGIPNLQDVLEQRYQSRTGMGLGIAGAKRLVDDFDIQTGSGGTVVSLRKALLATQPRLTPVQLGQLSAKLAAQAPQDAYQELQQQNGELLRTLSDLRNREAELSLLYTELQDSNRGLLALYSELDDKAKSLERMNQVRSRFFSHMSHEFRTPLNSILGLARLLRGESDGKLTSEQQVQVRYIQQGAVELLEMVGDLLDTAKFESGAVEVNFTPVDVAQLFGTLRGMMRPLQTNDAVTLTVEDPRDSLILSSDELKVGQILRNLISNALKFTERGSVRVSAEASPDVSRVVFSVADTGFGILAEHHERVFQEFAQVDNPAQKLVRGTGLGLPLSKKLAELLGGTIRLESEPGIGSTFYLELPLQPSAMTSPQLSVAAGQSSPPIQSDRDAVLVIDDDESQRYVVRRLFHRTRFEVIEASGGAEGLTKAKAYGPKLILLDLNMPDQSGEQTLAELQLDPTTSRIPVIIRTSRLLLPEEKRHLMARAAFIWNKSEVADGPMAAIAQLLNEPDLVSSQPVR